MDDFQLTDQKGQQKVVDQLTKIFKGNSLQFIQHYIDKSTVDIDMYVTTPLGNTYTYNLEAKDRTYSHTAFGGEWMIEQHKLKELLDKDGKPFYVNTFSDNWIIFWDLSKIDINSIRMEWKNLPNCTVDPSRGSSVRPVYYLPISQASYSSQFI
jgi:hypothetical protein